MKARPRQFCGVPGCGKSFDRPAKLLVHQRSHSGERPFQCAQCKQSFADRKHLRVHELQHLEHQLRPFVCSNCNKGFVARHQYDRHIQTHMSREPFQCDLCPMAFIQAKSYTNHKNRHRICSTCKKVCKDERDLLRHYSNQHALRFHCSFCDSKFANANELRSHCTNLHTDLLKTSNSIPEAVAFIVGLQYDERKFACTRGCEKRFKRAYDLERHILKEHPT